LWFHDRSGIPYPVSLTVKHHHSFSLAVRDSAVLEALVGISAQITNMEAKMAVFDDAMKNLATAIEGLQHSSSSDIAALGNEIIALQAAVTAAQAQPNQANTDAVNASAVKITSIAASLDAAIQALPVVGGGTVQPPPPPPPPPAPVVTTNADGTITTVTTNADGTTTTTTTNADGSPIVTANPTPPVVTTNPDGTITTVTTNADGTTTTTTTNADGSPISSAAGPAGPAAARPNPAR
jgi:hypothetical protein